MQEKSLHTALEKHFLKSGKAEWAKTAMRELRGKNPLETLSWCGKDGILFLPYYDTDDTARLSFLDGFRLPAAHGPGDKRAWANLPLVSVTAEDTANASAASHLASGADGVLFNIRHIDHPDVGRLLRGIPWQDCTLAFYGNTVEHFSGPLATFIQDNFFPASLKGALFWESIPKNTNWKFYLEACKHFRALGFLIPPATPAAEIADALLKGVTAMDLLSPAHDPDSIVRSVCFSLDADPSLLECAAKVRALRILWYQVAQSYGLSDYKPADLHIHARSARVADGAYAPHENMLKGTFSVVAAVLGGCDSATVECAEEPAMVSRQARNVSILLREESFFGAAQDALAGAYAFDAITNAIAEKAWTMFQEKCRQL